MQHPPASSEVTELLQQWSDGRPEALDELLPRVYTEFRRLAASYLRRERPTHTLEATALVHEADEALTRLASIDSQQSRVVELRFFGGLTTEETAEALHISPATVGRDWTLAKAWLYAALTAPMQ